MRAYDDITLAREIGTAIHSGDCRGSGSSKEASGIIRAGSRSSFPHVAWARLS